MSEDREREGQLPDVDAFEFQEIEPDLKNADEVIPVAQPAANDKPVAKKFVAKTKPIGKSVSAVSVKDIQKASKPRKSKLPYVFVALALLAGAGAFLYFQYFRKPNLQPAINISPQHSDKGQVSDVGSLYSTVQKLYDEVKSAKTMSNEDIVKNANEGIALVTQVKNKYNAIFDKCAEDEQEQIKSKFNILASIEGFFRGTIIKVSAKNNKAEEPKQEQQVSQSPHPQAESKEEKAAPDKVEEQPKSQEPQQKSVEETKPKQQPVEKPAQSMPPQPAEEKPLAPQPEEKKEEPPAKVAAPKEMSESDILKDANTIIDEVVAGVKRFKPDYTNIPKDSEAITILLDNTMDLIKNLDKARDELNQVRQKHSEPSYSYIDDKLKSIEVVRKYLLKQSEKLMAQLK